MAHIRTAAITIFFDKIVGHNEFRAKKLALEGVHIARSVHKNPQVEDGY
jgi:hypothetical protein